MGSFEYDSTKILIDKKILDMFLVNIVIREHKKDNSMFYSKNSMYRQMGYIFNNSFHLLKNYMKCINCYANYENDIKCNYCNYKYSENKILNPLKFNLITSNWNVKCCALGGILESNWKKVQLTKAVAIGIKRFVLK